MKPSIAIIVSNICKAISHEWVIEALSVKGYDVHCLLMNPMETPMKAFLVKKNIPHTEITYRGKHDLLLAIWKIFQYLQTHHIAIVHTHLFEASLAGLVAAKMAGIKKRICSRHHSTFHHDYFPRAVKFDFLINRMATDLIAASAVVQNVLIHDEKVSPEKIHLIHHGFQFNTFCSVSENDIEDLRRKYQVNGFPVIGVIARWTKWKGIQYTISAFKKLLGDFPRAQLVLANANGEYESEIRKHLNELPDQSYRIIVFEERFEALYRLFSIFVHVPINARCEAFGQVYVEALAAGIPSVFTLSGIAHEFIGNEQNALTVPYENSEMLYQSMKRLLTDKVLAARLAVVGKKDVEYLFQFTSMLTAFENLYMDQIPASN